MQPISHSTYLPVSSGVVGQQVDLDVQYGEGLRSRAVFRGTEGLYSLVRD